MQKILNQAELLGKTIVESERYKRLQEITKQVQADPEARQLLEGYSTLQGKLRRGEGMDRGAGSKEQAELGEWERRMRHNPLLQQLLRASADFTELMNKVHQALETSLRPAIPESKDNSGQ